MWVTICRINAVLSGQVPVAASSQALAIAEPALIEGSALIAQLSGELDVCRVVFELRGVLDALACVLVA